MRLFQAALKREAITAGALEYLDSAGFEYNEKCIPEEAFDLTLGQIEAIMGHDRLAKLFREDACRCIRQNRRPNFSVTGAQFQRITDVLYDGFGLSETPNRVERYFKYNGGACVRADSGEQKYLPCHNAVILFGGDMLSSFAAFCSDIDPTDPGQAAGGVGTAGSVC